MDISLKRRSITKIHKAKTDDILGSVLEKAKNSHDPIFLYKDREFQGLTSPQYAIFKKRYPRTTKAINASLMPPRITDTTSIFDVAGHMLSIKTYTLPLFKNGSVTGAVQAEDILQSISENNILNEVDIKISPPKKIKNTAKVKDAEAKMKKENVSRLIIVNDKGQLEGVVSRRDLQEAFTTPSRKLRYGNNSSKTNTLSFDNEKIKRGEFPLHQFLRRDIAKVDEGTKISDALKLMLAKKVGSVIFVNINNEPTGLVSTHTFLKALAGNAPVKLPNIILADKNDILKKNEKNILTKNLHKLASKIKKRHKIIQINTMLDSEKNVSGDVKFFRISLLIILDKEKTLYTKVTGSNLKLVMTEAAKKIENQLQKV